MLPPAAAGHISARQQSITSPPCPHTCCCPLLQVGTVIQEALQQYRDEVASRQFPSSRFSPYKIPGGEVATLVEELKQRGMAHVAEAVETYSAQH
jgi:hypothetical protein